MLDAVSQPIPGNTAVYVCRHFAAGEPALYVCWDEDGDLQVLCDREHAGTRGVILCWDDVLARDASLAVLVDMRARTQARRLRAGDPWQVEPLAEAA